MVYLLAKQALKKDNIMKVQMGDKFREILSLARSSRQPIRTPTGNFNDVRLLSLSPSPKDLGNAKVH